MQSHLASSVHSEQYRSIVVNVLLLANAGWQLKFFTSTFFYGRWEWNQLNEWSPESNWSFFVVYSVWYIRLLSTKSKYVNVYTVQGVSCEVVDYSNSNQWMSFATAKEIAFSSNRYYDSVDSLLMTRFCVSDLNTQPIMCHCILITW